MLAAQRRPELFSELDLHRDVLPLLPSWLQSPGVERASAISALLQLVWPTMRAAVEADVSKAANTAVSELMAKHKVCLESLLLSVHRVWKSLLHEVFVRLAFKKRCCKLHPIQLTTGF